MNVACIIQVKMLAHVTCRLHLYLHACNMHGFGTFSVHAACMLHENLHACNNISELKVAFQNFKLDIHVVGVGLAYILMSRDSERIPT